jgi:hypothetical protein
MITNEYMAGFFDGEGCINITICGKNRQTVLRVYVVNTDKDILLKIQSKFGGRLYHSDKGNNKGWKTFRCLDWRGPHAIKLLQSIYPHLLLKRPQADLAFKFYEFMQSDGRLEIIKRPTDLAKYRVIKQRTEEAKNRELMFKNAMHTLNKKGVL